MTRHLNELTDRWRARAADLEPFAPAAAAAFREACVQLETELTAGDVETVTLADAAAATGLHADSIGRRIRNGQTKNYGTKARPRVRLAELPHKPQPNSTPPTTTLANDGNTSALSSSDVASITRAAVASRHGRTKLGRV